MAANQLSPGVVIQERDLTTITTLSTANIGVLAAPFELGPVEEIVEIASERDLVDHLVNQTTITMSFGILLLSFSPMVVC